MAVINSQNKTNTQQKMGGNREDQKGEVINPLALKDSGVKEELELTTDPSAVLPPPPPGTYTLQLVAAEKDAYLKYESKDRNSGEVIGHYYKFYGTVVIQSEDKTVNGARFDISLSTRVVARKKNSEVAFFLASLGYNLPSTMSPEEQISKLAKFINSGKAFKAEVDWKAWAYSPDNQEKSGYFKYKTYDEFPDSETHEGKEWEGTFVDREGDNMVWRAKPFFHIGTAKLLTPVAATPAKPAPAKPATPAPVAKPSNNVAPKAKVTPTQNATKIEEPQEENELVEVGVEEGEEDELTLD